MPELWRVGDDVKALEYLMNEILEDESISEGDKESKLAEVFDDWVATSEDFKEKAVLAARYIRHLEAEGKAQREEALYITNLARRSERKAESLKKYVSYQLQRVGVKRVDGVGASVRIQKSPPHVKITKDLSEIPTEFLKVTLTPKKNEISKYLAENPDCDWATLVDSNISLIIS